MSVRERGGGKREGGERCRLTHTHTYAGAHMSLLVPSTSSFILPDITQPPRLCGRETAQCKGKEPTMARVCAAVCLCPSFLPSLPLPQRGRLLPAFLPLTRILPFSGIDDGSDHAVARCTSAMMKARGTHSEAPSMPSTLGLRSTVAFFWGEGGP